MSNGKTAGSQLRDRPKRLQCWCGPDDLVPEAGDAHGVSAGKGQHGPQGAGVRHGRVKQQGLLVQGRQRTKRLSSTLQSQDQSEALAFLTWDSEGNPFAQSTGTGPEAWSTD